MKKLTLPIIICLMVNVLLGQSAIDLPLFNIQDLTYKGAFRLPASEYGVSNLNYSEGPLEYNPTNHSIFIVSHGHEQAIAEFSIPDIIHSTEIEDLNMSGDPLQNFSFILDRAASGNTQNLDRIGGMQLVDGSLMVNCYEYYDANGDVTHSTLKINDATQLATSTVEGFYSFDGGAGQTSGWISKLSPEWADYLQADYVTGQSSGIPIISRTSAGPTAYTFKMEDVGSGGSIQTNQYLDFSYPNGIHEDLDNSEGENDKWTHLSRVTYGFVVPGTRTYLTLGKSGGHQSGVCYKCTQDDGNLCGGYCTPEVSDNYQYYWLWDMRDLEKVRKGEILPYEVQPYDYGVFDTPFQNGFNAIGGGSYDIATNQLFLSVQRADLNQGRYANPPVIVVYEPQSGQALPVEWISFDLKKIDTGVELLWSVANEVSHEYYQIEKLQEKKWVILGKVDSSYSFIDRNPHSGVNTYRIRQVDFNGDFSFSPVRKINFRKEGDLVLRPNPVLSVLNVEANGRKVFIFSSEGHLMMTSKDSQIDVAQLSSGIYFARIENQYYKFIKL